MSQSGTLEFKKNIFPLIGKWGLSIFCSSSYHQTGTATSFPETQTASQTNIVNVMLWMKNSTYEVSTIKQPGKKLKHLTASQLLNKST